MQQDCPPKLKLPISGAVTLKAASLVALSTLVSACGVTSRLEPYKQTDAVIGAGEQVVVLARKNHANHEAEEDFVDCISDALADGKNGIAVHSSTEFEDMMYQIGRAHV